MQHITNKIICSISVATYKRPAQLSKLIKSLYSQKDIRNIDLEMIIIDNDINQSARSIVNKFDNQSGVTIHYFNQPVQNISLTRNVGLDNSTGEYIAIIDDDEYADAYWIKNHIATALKYGADVVFGFIKAIFPDNVPSWIGQREVYFKPMGETGDMPSFYYTGNCLIKTSFLSESNARFDPQYGLSGGEDSIFFESLLKRGAKFVVCREAVTYEKIPENRTKLSFIFNRSLQRGNNYGRQFISGKSNKIQATRIKLFIKSIIAVIYYGGRVILLYPFKKFWIYSYIDLIQNIGKIGAVFNYKTFMYKKNN